MSHVMRKNLHHCHKRIKFYVYMIHTRLLTQVFDQNLSQHLIIICDNLMCDSDDMIQDKYYTNKKLIINSDRVSLGLSHGISQLVTGSYSRYLSCFMIVVLWHRRNIDFFFVLIINRVQIGYLFKLSFRRRENQIFEYMLIFVSFFEKLNNI